MANNPYPAHGFEKNVARLMVRRHLRSWTKSDVISEDLLMAMFIRTSKQYPDEPMSQIADRVDLELRGLVAIILGQDSTFLADETPGM